MSESRTRSIAIGALAGALLSFGSIAGAQSANAPKPKISKAEARRVALSEVPGGKIESAELETEHGHLIYSFDIKVKGKRGVEEVNVDALNGKVLAHEHEGPAAEQKEKAAEAKEKPAKP